MLGQEALGVKLNALERQTAVAKAHDLIPVCPGGHLEIPLVEGPGPHDQRVVPRGGERAGNPREEAAAVVVDPVGLSVHQLRGAFDGAAVPVGDALVAQADAQGRDSLLREPGDDFTAGTRLAWGAWAGRDDQV